MTQSILLTIKKMLGIDQDYHAFDIDIVTNINAVFLTLYQLGVGPSTPYEIAGEEETWEEFFGDSKKVPGVQSYIYQRVRLMFDPPTNSFLVQSFEKQIAEFEWRMNVYADPRHGNYPEVETETPESPPEQNRDQGVPWFMKTGRRKC